MEKKYILSLSSMTPKEAEEILSRDGTEFRAMIDPMAKAILEKKPTPVQAVAILVQVLGSIEENCCLQQRD